MGKRDEVWFHTHTHSEFSALDAISSVETLVAKAAKMGQPAMGLTDHGNMAGTVQLYRAGQKHGIKVFPGFEGYLCVDPIVEGDKETGKNPRYHIGMLALNLKGYRVLREFTSLTHTRPRFNRFPRHDLSDLAKFASPDVALLTGCFFGLVQQTLVEKGKGPAKRIVEMYSRWYPNTFVEIQNHNIVHDPMFNDADICDVLVDIADELGLPVIVTQDSHYCDQSQEVAHKLMKRMVYKGEGATDEFPGDSFHLATTQWVKEHHKKKHWKKGLEGSAKLLELHDLKMPALDNYVPHVPTITKNPLRWLKKEIIKGLDRLEREGLLTKSRKVYQKRIDHELDIVEHLGSAGYFSLVCMVIDYCKDEEICVEARGSANGFLICYLLGITSVDPVHAKLTPERFLSKDRKKPPDVDLDIEDVRRPDVVAFMDKQIGAMQIGTYQQLGARDNDDKGSLLVTYNAYLRAKLGNDVFIPRYGKGLETVGQARSVSVADYKGLRALGKTKVKRAYGVHPAGLLLNGDTLKIEDYVPTMLVASSNTLVSQFSGEDVEEFGYLKFDLLGQRTLTMMKRCQELIGRADPTDFSWIPLNDSATCKYLSKGQQDNGIFQFEGYAMARGARTLKIRSTNDCILAGALFRPACIDSGVTDTYIARRRDPDSRKDIDYPHPAFAEVLKETYGVVLFQEQVLEIMRRLGLDYAGINTFFKIVKDSGKGATARNVERIKEVEAVWEDICKKNKIKDPDWAWHYIEGYTKYGFNKAHSAGYGIRSYRAGYLKVHHPLEFMAALLESNAGKMKEPLYIREARNMEIRLLPADVNISGPHWTIDRKRGAIRRGLSSIKGIGVAAAEEIAGNAPYDDMDDLLDLNSARSVSGAPKFKKEGLWSGNLEKLKNAGALNSLGIDKDDDE